LLLFPHPSNATFWNARTLQRHMLNNKTDIPFRISHWLWLCAKLYTHLVYENNI
jgi:hypothetical protein